MTSAPVLLEEHGLSLTVQGQAVSLKVLMRDGAKPTIVILHGFGSIKEDFADIALMPAFDGHGVMVWDAPGFGASRCADLAAVSIAFMVACAEALLDAFDISTFHLVGHSMGGLTGLCLAKTTARRVLSFSNVEGNVAPEDCFLSRQIVDFPAKTPGDFLDAFIVRTKQRPALGSAAYAANLSHRVQAQAVGPVFRSMVALSDGADLLNDFTRLSCPRSFVYGDANHHLSYLSHLEAKGVILECIPHSEHFPMYSNPPAFWVALARPLSMDSVKI